MKQTNKKTKESMEQNGLFEKINKIDQPGPKLSEHSPRMEYEEILSASKKTAQESCDLSFLKAQICSWNEFSCSSQVWWIGVSLLQL